jgi:chemotaxis family two-component system response regulator Rcp1
MTDPGTAGPSGKGTVPVSGRSGETGGRREILLVEDSQGDVRLIREALREICGGHVLHVVNDGVEALAFLHRTGAYVSAPRPDLVLLDLNLPRKNGREVLYEIKRDEQLRDIPVIVLTISTAEEDIMTAYRLRANCYVIKPVNLDNFFRVLNSVARYWLSGARARDGDGHGG